MTGGPTVVYVAGSGRSGSTLLERTLGEMPGFVNVGELIDLFRRVAPRNERCGCGQPFTSRASSSVIGEQLSDIGERIDVVQFARLDQRRPA